MAKPAAAAQPSDESLRRWHRLFGLLLSDHLAGSPFAVVLEMDLSHKQQFLDVLIVRRRNDGVTPPLPDGLDDLAPHNLISFKSYREPLNDWALKELTAHYVNYRKQASPRGRLLPEDEFRMIAVCARQPRDLFAAVAPEHLRPGVYLCRRGSDEIRVVVAADLPRVERNALLHLFSAAPEQVQYGAEHYRVQSAQTSTIVSQLFASYRVEGLNMPYTMEDFRRDIAREVLQELTPEERLAGLTPEQRLAGLDPEQRLAGLGPEQRLAGLGPEEILARLSAEQIEAYLKRLGRQSSPTGKRKRPRP